jgi:gamma-glutamyltranspeptidase/glutathione hydrolase
MAIMLFSRGFRGDFEFVLGEFDGLRSELGLLLCSFLYRVATATLYVRHCGCVFDVKCIASGWRRALERTYNALAILGIFFLRTVMSRRFFDSLVCVGTLAIAMWEVDRMNAQESATSSKAAPAIGRYDRPSGSVSQSRSVVMGTNGMACTSDPRATQAAIQVLAAGGTAVDAAIAANAMLGVVEPMSCGIGGDLYAIVWDATSQKLHGLNASGRSPAKLTREVFADRNLKEIPLHGPLSWSVPGCVSGWYDLHSKFGRLSMSEVLAPAIQTAEVGFPVSPVIGGFWSRADVSFEKWPDSKRTFLLESKKPPRAGDTFRNPRLAASYRKVAAGGPDAFYRDSIAEEIVRFSKANGGYFEREDFAEHRNEWVEPISTTYRGYDVWQIPPNGQGLSVLQMLNVLSQYDVASMGWGSPQYLHLLLESKKLAYADRAKFYADMAFEKVPVDGLKSTEYAKKQASRIDLSKASIQLEAGDPKLVQGDTVYLCVVDKDRNCCSLIQSNYHGFGSYVVPGEVGFALQNRGNLFSLDPTHANRLEPRKRPFHTIIPAMVTKAGKPVFVFGVMGGDMQPQGQVQVLVNWIDFGMNIQMAGDAARVRHEGSATPTGILADPKGGVVHYESGIPAETIRALEAMGHQTKPGRSSMGGYQGILIDWERNLLQGATESRNDGMALGW